MSLNLNVAKFGGTSVADFDAMNRSADVVLQDSNTRLVVLSASAGITNLLVSLAEGQETSQRAAQLDDINTPSSIVCKIRTSFATKSTASLITSACCPMRPRWPRLTP